MLGSLDDCGAIDFGGRTGGNTLFGGCDGGCKVAIVQTQDGVTYETFYVPPHRQRESR